MPERLVIFAERSATARAAPKPAYQLLALPPALLEHLTASTSTQQLPDVRTPPLEIRGDDSDSAVVVTQDRTYSLRGVQNSNSLCVCAAGHGAGARRRGAKRWFSSDDPDENESGDEGDAASDGEADPKRLRPDPTVEIEAVLHETLEAVPSVARLEKLEALLRGTEYTGDDAESNSGQQLLAFDDLRSRLPASDAEIRTALSRLRVVTRAGGHLRPLPPSYLLQLVPATLSSLPLPARLAHPDAAAGNKKKKDKGKAKAAGGAGGPELLTVEADEQDVLDALEAVDCSDEDLARQFLGFFGTRETEGRRPRWALDVVALVKELGIVLMARGGYGPQPVGPFLERWKTLAGGFAPLCELSLLLGLHLLRPPPLSTIQYLPPSRLSADPAARFAELFTLQPRWLESEMMLFIDDLTGGDKKKRDALVLKFVRKVREKEVVFWTARNLWA